MPDDLILYQSFSIVFQKNAKNAQSLEIIHFFVLPLQKILIKK